MIIDALTLIAVISQILASLSVIVGIPFALIQLRNAAYARNLEALSKIFEEFRSREFFTDRRFVYSHERFEYSACSIEEKDRIERLINTYNRISFLVFKRLMPRNLVLEMYSGAFIASWQKLESYIISRRAATGFSDWAIYFERMATFSKRYREKILKEQGIDYKIPVTQVQSIDELHSEKLTAHPTPASADSSSTAKVKHRRTRKAR